jgi:hypothetical protein
LHRRAPLLIMIAFAITVFAGIALAEPNCTGTTCVYVPVASAISAPLNALTIQPSEIRSGYAIAQSREVTNAEAANGYQNANTALKDFAAQGRETSWLVSYSTTAYGGNDALGISDQVYRYTTPAGAALGQAYTLAEEQREYPEYHSVDITLPCCPTVTLGRTFEGGHITSELVLMSVQVGRYVADVKVVWLRGSTITVDMIIAYAQTAANHLLATQQAIQSSSQPTPYGQSPPTGITPSLESLRAATHRRV